MKLDTILHIPLYLGLGATSYGIAQLDTPFVAVALLGSGHGYLREVTQEQVKHYEGDFRRGWNPLEWSTQKVNEWVAPSAFLIVCALIMEFTV